MASPKEEGDLHQPLSLNAYASPAPLLDEVGLGLGCFLLVIGVVLDLRYYAPKEPAYTESSHP